MEIKDFFNVVKKYLWIILISEVLVLALSFFFVSKQKDMYQAKSQVMVRTETPYYGRIEELPTLAGLDILEGYRNVQTQVEILRSNIIYDKTVKALELTEEKTKSLGINVQPVENADIITILVKSPFPDVATNFANKLPEVYLDYTMEQKLSDVKGSSIYLEEQIEKIQVGLTKAEEDLRNFKLANNITNLDEETSRKVAQLISFETKEEETRIELDSTRSKMREVQQQLSESDRESIARETVVENPIVRNLTEQLTRLEIEHAKLSESYSQIHPQVAQVAAQIEEMKKQLLGMEEKILTEVTTAPNPQYQSLLESYAALRAEETALGTRLTGLNTVIKNSDNALQELPDDEINLIRLIRNKSLQEHLYIALQEKLQDYTLARQTQKVPGRITSIAKGAVTTGRKARMFTMLIGAIMGLVLGLVVAVALEYMNDTIETPEQLESALHLTVLGQIPYDDIITDTGVICADKPNTPVAESFRALRSRLRHNLKEKGMNSFLVTSTAVQEGKSFIAVNLAATFAQFGDRVILVDGDLRRPTIHKRFGVENKGTTNVFIDKHDVSDFIIETKIPNLSILPSGPLILTEDTPIISSEIFESDIIKSMIEMLKVSFDILIIDTPPIMAVTDSLIISSLVDSTLFVVSSGDLPKKEITQAKSILETASTPLIGSVLNRTQFTHSYYRYLYYYYDHQTGERKRHR